MDCNIKNGTDIDMFMMVVKGIRRVDFVTLYFNYDENKDSSCLMYLDKKWFIWESKVSKITFEWVWLEWHIHIYRKIY